MKRIVIALAFLSLPFGEGWGGALFAQVPYCSWAKRGGGIDIEYGQSVATDASNNVYVCGYFTTPTITFGSTTLSNTTGPGYSDLYLVKYNSNGSVLWAVSSGGVGSDRAQSVATDGLGNVYVVGSFIFSITFGSYTLTTPDNYDDIFVVKYDSGGNVLWATSAGSVGGYDDAYSVATDASGNVLVAGICGSPITFGSYTLTTGFEFVTKYDSSGNVLWARSATGSSSAGSAISLASDASNNVYVGGYFQSASIIFGLDTLINNQIAGNSNDMFLVKYDSSGNVLWATNSGGPNGDNATSVATDDFGNVFVSGGFQGPTITFGSYTLGPATSGTTFFVKYDSTGNVLWAKQEDGCGASVATDASGNLYSAGGFSSSSTTFGSTTLVNAGFGPPDYWQDVVIVKYDSAGNVLWALGAGGALGDVAQSVATDASGSLLVAGYFISSSITFPPQVLTNAATWNSDMFVAKFDTTFSGVAINELSNSDNVSIYPNPSNGKFTINVKGELEIYNVLGEKIYHSTITSPKSEIDLSEKAKGIYFLQLQSAEKTYSQKLIIQ